VHVKNFCEEQLKFKSVWTNVVVFVLSTLIQFHYMSKEWPGYSLKFHFLCSTEEIKAKQVCGNRIQFHFWVNNCYRFTGQKRICS